MPCEVRLGIDGTLLIYANAQKKAKMMTADDMYGNNSRVLSILFLTNVEVDSSAKVIKKSEYKTYSY